MKIDSINRAEAFRYMGYKGGEINDTILKITDECEEKLLEVINPKYVYKVFDIEINDDGVKVKNTSLVFKGKDISSHLKDCEKCILLCATVSGGADRLIRSYEAGQMEKAVITDCLASTAVEQVCNEAEIEIRNEIGEWNYTWRFSPGYGDFPIDIQKDFLDVLDAPKRTGVNVTDSLILIPRKSVTAVIGLSHKEISRGRRGCVTCNMRDRCEFRKRGEHCGI